MSASKVLAFVFWDALGTLFIGHLEKGNPINSEYYMALLVRLKEKNCNKTTPNEEAKSFHNAPCHKSIATMAKFHELYFELLPYPPYFLDLAPSDYYPFADLKSMLQEKRVGSNEEVIAETEAYYCGQILK